MSSEENIWSDVEIDFGDGEVAVVEKEKVLKLSPCLKFLSFLLVEDMSAFI